MNPPLLNESNLSLVREDIKLPMYDRSKHGAGIVHLGIGAFHRAHQAVYTDDILATQGGDWMIIGASLQTRNTRDQLIHQDYLYSLKVANQSRTTRIIGAVKDVLYAPDAPQHLITTMASPDIKIITLTITEKGYLQAEDSEALTNPRTAIEYLVASLAMRRSLNHPPVTLLSCDNLSRNGDKLKAGVMALAATVDKSLANWIDTHITFPNSMVDRIVPAQTEQLREQTAETLGLTDNACLLTEPFSQWVIEDKFAAGRPDWHKVGVTFSSEIHQYETMKLRLLNGAHSAIAYTGLLLGKTTVAETMAEPILGNFIKQLMAEEIRPTVTAPDNHDLNLYIEQLIERFSNQQIHHRCAQIAMDGSQKLPQRILATIHDRLTREPLIHGEGIERLCLVVAAWMLTCRGEISDPMQAPLKTIAEQHQQAPSDWVSALLELETIFDPWLRDSLVFRRQLTSCLTNLLNLGLSATLARMNKR